MTDSKGYLMIFEEAVGRLCSIEHLDKFKNMNEEKFIDLIMGVGGNATYVIVSMEHSNASKEEIESTKEHIISQLKKLSEAHPRLIFLEEMFRERYFGKDENLDHNDSKNI